MTHDIPIQLYVAIKKNMQNKDKQIVSENAEFVQSLPVKLRFTLAEHIYQDVYEKIDVLKD